MPPMPRPPIPRPGCTKRPKAAAKPSSAYQGHVLMENRHGLVVDTRVTQATGTAEREAALAMAEAIPAATGHLGRRQGYDTRDFVRELRELRVTPHVAQNTTRRSSAIDGRTTRHPGYAVSQRKRKRVEEIFGWMKTVALLRKTRHRGVPASRVDVHLCGGRGKPRRARAPGGQRGRAKGEGGERGAPFPLAPLSQTERSTTRDVPKILPSQIRNVCEHRCSTAAWRFSAACYRP